MENANLRRKIRNLEIEKKQLDEKCSQLSSAIYMNSEKRSKIAHEKPFISTVRSETMVLSKEFLESVKDRCHLHCPKSLKKTGIYKELERVKSDYQHSQDVIAILQQQEEEKDREIQRLNCLFAGGRPPAALAKDCCYKDVSKISEDLGKLQREKVEMQVKLNDCIDHHKKLQTKFNNVKRKNSELLAYINEIGDAALFVEREANLKIKDQKQKINELKESLSKTGQEHHHSELKNLKKTLKEKSMNEEKLLFEVEYLKAKLKEIERESTARNSDFISELMKERDFFQNKYEIFMGKADKKLLGNQEDSEVILIFFFNVCLFY